MSRTEALRRAGQLREALLDYGVRRVSIEIQQGRPGTPHDRWYDTRFIGSMGHHIVSLRSQGLTPGLALVKRGRTDVPGPLCNGYGGFDLIARIICMGWANHPGAGGPYSLPGGTIPRDAARPYLFGWEFEGGVREADWTDAMRKFMGRCHAGTLDWLGRGSTSHIEHKTWAPTRKIDRLRYTLAEARAEIRAQPRLASGGTSGGGGVSVPSPTTPTVPTIPEEDQLPSVDEVWTGYTIASGPQKGDVPITALAEAATFSLEARNRAGEILATQAKLLAELAELRAAVAKIAETLQAVSEPPTP